MTQELNAIAIKLKSFPSMPGAAVQLLALIDIPDIYVTQSEQMMRQNPV